MSYFRSEDRDGTLLVTLDRPPLNALSADVLEEGVALLQAAAANPPEAGLVLTGAGKAFTAGVDVKEAASTDRTLQNRLLWGINDISAALCRLPCAFVAAVNGHAIGAGGIVTIAADWTVIADCDLKIGLPEAKAGLAFPRIPQIVMEYGLSPTWHRRLALTSELFGAADSIESGLADELVAPDALVETALARARALQEQAAFGDIKANMLRKARADIDSVYAEREARRS
jgi:enoyl-CoA hydratase/carnithine racemase